MSKKIIFNEQRRKQLMLKPYSAFYSYKFPYNSNYELEDLNDMRNASINELEISFCVPLNTKFAYDLTELLSNTNIKRIILNFNIFSTRLLLHISKLIKCNTTIKEIDLIFSRIARINSLNHIKKQAIAYFLNTISNRLVSTYNIYTWENDDINKILLSNSNLKKIELFLNLDSGHYLNILKYILSSNKYLDEFVIRVKDSGVNKEFFDYISKSDEKAFINTLDLADLESDSSLLIIENAYLFKTETITISININSNNKLIIDYILKLSNNPINTVKSVKIYGDEEIDVLEIISELLNSNSNYALENIPKLYLDGYKEVIIKINSENIYEISSLFENREDINDGNEVILNIKNNSFDEEELTMFFHFLFIDSDQLNSLSILYDDSDDSGYSKNKDDRDIRDIRDNRDDSDDSDDRDDSDNSDDSDEINKIKNPPAIINNIPSMVDKINELYKNLKPKYINFKRMEIKKLKFDFDEDAPELNVFYFTILEIMIDLKIKINDLSLSCCSITELAEFMDKHRELESLNINNINIYSKQIDKEITDQLYQYSHLIKGKINIRLHNDIEIDESIQLKLIDTFELKFRKNNNFINLITADDVLLSKKLIEISSNSEINSLIRNIKFMKDIFGLDYNLCSKNIVETHLDYGVDVNLLSEIFSLFKEYKYALNNFFFTNSNKVKERQINFMSFEIILDIKGRENNTFFSCDIGNARLNRKFKRYSTLHIYNKEYFN